MLNHQIKCITNISTFTVIGDTDICGTLTNKGMPTHGLSLSLSLSRRLVTCGHDCDVTIFVGLEDDDKSEFSLSSSTLSALVCYTTGTDGSKTDVVAVAMDDFTVQAYTTDVREECNYKCLSMYLCTIMITKCVTCTCTCMSQIVYV